MSKNDFHLTGSASPKVYINGHRSRHSSVLFEELAANSASMKNSLTYSLPFSFKGEAFRPSCTLDLDKHMNLVTAGLPCLYSHIANVNRIDIYSHEYDVMMMGDIEFEAAEGMAAEFIHDGQFDSEGFQAQWHANKLHNTVQAIASRYMGIDDIASEPGLKEALIEAFERGRRERRQIPDVIEEQL